MRILAAVLFILCALPALRAQDAVLSTSHVATTHLNPASYGLFDGSVRITAAYRNQWRGTGANFNTIFAALDGKVVGFNDRSYLGFGVQAMSDRAGDLSLRTTQVNGGLNYALSFSRYRMHWLSVGIRAGMVQSAIDFSGVNDVFDTGDPSFGTTGGSQIAVDLGAGIFYYLEATDAVSLFGGFSADHLGRPTLDLAAGAGADEELEVRFAAQVGADIRLTDRFSLLPSVLSVHQIPHDQIQFGSAFRVDLGGDHRSSQTALSLGIDYRLNFTSVSDGALDALLATARLDHKRLTAALTYDLNLSGLLEATNGYGGVEASVIYRVGSFERAPRSFVGCPSF